MQILFDKLITINLVKLIEVISILPLQYSIFYDKKINLQHY